MLSAIRRPTYLDILPTVHTDEVQTGDLVLFSGRTLAAWLVRGWTGSYWSHVGIVVCLPEYGPEPLLWELTRASNVADVRHGTIFDGMQLVPLGDKLASYPGEVAVRRLQGVAQGPYRHRCLRALLRQWGVLPYSNFFIKQLIALRHGPDAAALPHGGFCSEFVAEVYKRLQLLPHDKPSIDYLPRDFGPEAVLPLLRGRLSAPYLLVH